MYSTVHKVRIFYTWWIESILIDSESNDRQRDLSENEKKKSFHANSWLNSLRLICMFEQIYYLRKRRTRMKRSLIVSIQCKCFIAHSLPQTKYITNDTYTIKIKTLNIFLEFVSWIRCTFTVESHFFSPSTFVLVFFSKIKLLPNW